MILNCVRPTYSEMKTTGYIGIVSVSYIGSLVFTAKLTHSQTIVVPNANAAATVTGKSASHAGD